MKAPFAFAYAGGYAPHSTEVRIFQIDLDSGLPVSEQSGPAVTNPSWMSISRDGQTLYAVSEVDNGGASGREGVIHAYAIDGETGALTAINQVGSSGTSPVCLVEHPSQNYLFVANYGDGSIAVYGVHNGTISPEPSDRRQPVWPIGPVVAAEAPEGSFANSGHDGSHAHFVLCDPTGKHLLHTDLGQDRIYVWGFDDQSGQLTESEEAAISTSPGSGARHLVFHPTGNYLYAVTEESSQLYVYDFDVSTGQLVEQQRLYTLPEGFKGTNYASDLVVTTDGRFLLVANRLHDSIGVYAIESTTGLLTRLSHTHTGGDYPRSLCFDPIEHFLYVCNQLSDSISIFSFDQTTGTLTSTGEFIALGSPAKVAFRF